MEYQIQIKKDGEWVDLELYEDTIVRYNVITNKIGEPSKREISHSNTYNLPRSSKNVLILGLNKFNSYQLTKALNTKFDCRLLNRGKVINEAFLIINTTSRIQIKVNVIDKALALLDQWGSVSLFEMLDNPTLFNNLPESFKTVINQMKNYRILETTLPILSNIPGKDYPYAIFPNTLNVIGDGFNEDTDGNRIPVDRINVAQTRPLFNAKSFIESICYAYNYTPIFENKVDVKKLEESYIVPSGGGEGDPFESSDYPSMDRMQPPEDHYRSNGDWWRYFQRYRLPESPRISKPNDYPEFVDPPGIVAPGSNYVARDWKDYPCIYKPITESGDKMTGRLSYSADFRVMDRTGFGVYEYFYIDDYDGELSSWFVIQAMYREAVTGTISYRDIEFEGDDDYTQNKSFDDRDKLELVIEKSKIDLEIGTGSFPIYFVGVMVIGIFSRKGRAVNPCMINMQLVDEWAGDGLVYNEHNEYFAGNYPNLLRNGPEEPVKKLFSGLLNQQGLLCHINDKEKSVKLFNYEDIKTKILARNHYDWSKYLLMWLDEETDTSFGEKYAKINRVSLNEPYRGNHYDFKLADQGVDSKYKDFIESKVETYKDVTGLQLVNLGGNHPYYEYTNEGLGLVSSNSFISGLIQRRVNGNESGTTPLPHVQNYNYSELPIGVISWYEIINSGLRVNGLFLLPEEVVYNFDVTKPVYLESIRATLIVEEIKEYTNSQTPVEVKFILPGLFSPQYQ